MSRSPSETIRRLEELWLEARELAIDAALERGEHRAVVPELDALVAEHPLRERLHAQRMLALYRCGRQADALEAFRHARTVLDEQVGLEPGRALRELNDRILQQDESLSAGEPEAWLIRARRRRRAGSPPWRSSQPRHSWSRASCSWAERRRCRASTGTPSGSSTRLTAGSPSRSRSATSPPGSPWAAARCGSRTARTGPCPASIATAPPSPRSTWASCPPRSPSARTRCGSRTPSRAPCCRSTRARTASPARFAVGNSPRAVGDRLRRAVGGLVDRRPGRPRRPRHGPLDAPIGAGSSCRPRHRQGRRLGGDRDGRPGRAPRSAARAPPLPPSPSARPRPRSPPDDEDVWVVNRGDATVSRIDSATGVVTRHSRRRRPPGGARSRPGRRLGGRRGRQARHDRPRERRRAAHGRARRRAYGARTRRRRARRRRRAAARGAPWRHARIRDRGLRVRVLRPCRLRRRHVAAARVGLRRPRRATGTPAARRAP